MQLSKVGGDIFLFFDIIENDLLINVSSWSLKHINHDMDTGHDIYKSK